jgi:hypothetical protein
VRRDGNTNTDGNGDCDSYRHSNGNRDIYRYDHSNA